MWLCHSPVSKERLQGPSFWIPWTEKLQTIAQGETMLGELPNWLVIAAGITGVLVGTAYVYVSSVLRAITRQSEAEGKKHV